METTIKQLIETDRNLKVDSPVRLYNPEGMDFKNGLRVKSIEATAEYTRIDFIYKSSMIYDNGGWIQMDSGCFIRPIGSETRYRMVSAINIPLAPSKYYFKSKGQVHHFSLLFPPLPKSVKQIDIIERFSEGTYFNFFRVSLQHNEPTLIRIVNEN
jgi:hypothetical protein